MKRKRSELKIITPVGCIGNRGVDKESFTSAVVSERPDAIAVDAGTMDCGPWYLGSGAAHSPVLNIEWDIETILDLAVPRKIPVIIGSAGGSGARAHVDSTVEIIERLSKEKHHSFRMAVIYSDVQPQRLIGMANKGVVGAAISMKDGTPLAVQDIQQCNVIVAAMGVEPIIAALESGADVVVAGRAVDAAVIAAVPIANGFDRSLAYHMGDIMECAESAAEELRPTLRAMGHNRIPIIGTIRDDHFLLKPARDTMGCTVTSCLTHSLYERASIDHFRVPGGIIDRSRTAYEQVDENTTRVSGTRFTEEPYSVILEGVKRVGYRSLFMFAVRTPEMIAHLDEILAGVTEVEKNLYRDHGKFEIYWHRYGANAVLGAAEFANGCYEVGVVADVVAETQALAHDIAYEMFTRIAFWRYPGRYTTAGNIAVTFSPGVFDGGEVFEFGVYHVLKVRDPQALFRTEIVDIPRRGTGPTARRQAVPSGRRR